MIKSIHSVCDASISWGRDLIYSSNNQTMMDTRKKQNKTKQNKKKTKTKQTNKKKTSNTQCGNTGEQILQNEPRKQWIAGSHSYKTIFL